MNKIIISTVATLLFALTAQAQNRFNWSVELGSQNTIGVEYRLSKHWNMGAKTGIGLAVSYDGGDRRIHFDGFVPFAEMTTNWHFSSKSTSDYYRSGAYLGIRFTSDFNKYNFLNPNKRPTSGATVLQLGFIPTFGWTIPVNQKHYVRLSAGIDIRWGLSKYSEVKKWEPMNRNHIPIALETTYGIRF